MQTLLWVNTAATRSLGAVRLLGEPVAITVAVDHVDWSFGDGTTDTSTSAGKAYTSADPCDTALCPGYYGHVYRATGPMTVTATVTWTGRFRIGGGAWQPIPGNVSGPTTTTRITVREARGVLVPDPGTR
jgi:hypothetical protein